MDILWWLVPLVIAGILIYLALDRRCRKRKILSRIHSLDSTLISIDGQVFRYLGVNGSKIFVEDFTGQVHEKPFRDLRHISKPHKTLVFYLKPTKDPEYLYQKVRRNPYLPDSAVAICEEAVPGQDNVRLRLCIKEITDFQKIKQFLKYLQSHL